MTLNRRRMLGLAAVAVVALAMVIAAVLGQWVVFAVAGTLLLAAICVLSLWAVATLRTLSRRSSAADQRAARLEKSLARLTERQQTMSKELAAEVTEVRSGLQRVETTDTALLDRVSHAERRLVGILESLRLELEQGRGDGRPDGAAPAAETTG